MPSAFGDRGYTQSPVSYNGNQALPAMRNDSMRSDHIRNDSMRSMTSDPHGRAAPRAEVGARSYTPGGAPSMGRQTPFAEMGTGGRSSPAPSLGRQTPFAEMGTGGRSSPAPGGYQPYNPQGSAQPPQQYRNMTEPGLLRGPQGGDGYSGGGIPLPSPMRSATGGFAVSGRGTPEGISRLASPAPYNTNANGRGSPMGPPNPQYRR